MKDAADTDTIVPLDEWVESHASQLAKDCATHILVLAGLTSSREESDLLRAILTSVRQWSRSQSLASSAVTMDATDAPEFFDLYQTWIDGNGSRSPSIRHAMRWMFDRLANQYDTSEGKK